MDEDLSGFSDEELFNGWANLINKPGDRTKDEEAELKRISDELDKRDLSSPLTSMTGMAGRPGGGADPALPPLHKRSQYAKRNLQPKQH